MPTAKHREQRRKVRKSAELEDKILEKYTKFGLSVLADPVPKRLDPVLRKEMETIIGVDLPEVRIHTGEGAKEMAEALGARAFAVGRSDIFFGQGEFAPQTSTGKALLAHELSHVAEGKAGLARRPRRPEREEVELRAKRVEEMVLAKEESVPMPKEEEMLEPVDIALPPMPETGPETQETLTTVDKTQLEEKIIEAIERETKRSRERRGLF